MTSLGDKIEIGASTQSRKTGDDSLKTNADFQDKAGLEVRVSRTYDGVGLSGGRECQWCLDRECSNVTLDEAYRIGAFQRHPGCGCEIEYTSARGIKTIQTGKYSGWNYAEELEKRKAIGLDEEFLARELESRVEPYIELDKNIIISEAKAGAMYWGEYNQAILKPRRELENSIKSHIKQAELHEWKIHNPEKNMKKGDPNNPKDLNRAIRDWTRHRRRNSQVAMIEIDVWRNKYG